MKEQIEIKFDVNAMPEPTIPVNSWVESRADYHRGPVVCDPQGAVSYFKKYIGGKPREAFLCMYLDHRNHVLDVVLEGEGTIDHVAVYPREICRRALELEATGLILSHCHPSGSLEPSEGDKALTRQLLTGAKALGITIHDHLIVAHEGHFSFRQAGLI